MSEDFVDKMKRVLKPGDVCVCRRNCSEPIVMEVVGKKGCKVAEYVDNGDDKLPNYVLVEEARL